MGSRSSLLKDSFEAGKRRPITGTLRHELCKKAETVEMPFGMLSLVDPRNHVSDWVHIGATWRIRLNLPCAAAMRPFCQMTDHLS